MTLKTKMSKWTRVALGTIFSVLNIFLVVDYKKKGSLQKCKNRENINNSIKFSFPAHSKCMFLCSTYIDSFKSTLFYFALYFLFFFFLPPQTLPSSKYLVFAQMQSQS